MTDSIDYSTYESLKDTSLIPEIRAQIQENLNEVIETYKSYATKENVPEDDINNDVELINKAFVFAYKAHINQRRKSNEPYIIHPVATAAILTELEVDGETIAAALLHDTIEDTNADRKLLQDIFGNTIAILVEGVTKLTQLSDKTKEEEQANNVIKMLMAMNEDVRVILIKLADRLHNMRTMQYQTPEKRVEKANETLDIYVPLAERFGIFRIKMELEDLCLRHINEKAYYELVGLVSSKRSVREEFMATVVGELSQRLENYGIKHFEIEGRPKHFYSIYKKMHDKNKSISEIYDMYACRIIVDNLTDCYAVLGLVHEMYMPLPGRFKDYIGNPKENGYQSIHTTVKRPGGNEFNETTFEVQIRTYTMHRDAEYGIASHWHYKESGNSKYFKEDSYDKYGVWVRQLLEAQKDSDDPKEFLNLLKANVSIGDVFVFTPKGKVIRLPKGSCPIDFAYTIHSNIGNHMHGAKVNGRIVPLSYELQNGDSVEILSSEKIKGPSKDWAKMVKTASARSKINAWFKKEQRGDNIAEGKERLLHEIERNGFSTTQLIRPEFYNPVFQKYSYNSLDDLYAAIGYGAIAVSKAFGRLRDEYIKSLSEDERMALGYRTTSDGGIVYYNPSDLPAELGKGDQNKSLSVPKTLSVESKSETISKKARRAENSILVEGLNNASVHIAKCCHPVPGDPIIGYVTQNSGVGVHRVDCKNITNIAKYANRSDKDREREARIVKVFWPSSYKETGVFEVELSIRATDRNYLLIDVLNTLREEHINVDKTNSRVSPDFIAEINLTITVRSHEQYDRVVGRIKGIKDIISVGRM